MKQITEIETTLSWNMDFSAYITHLSQEKNMSKVRLKDLVDNHNRLIKDQEKKRDKSVEILAMLRSSLQLRRDKTKSMWDELEYSQMVTLTIFVLHQVLKHFFKHYLQGMNIRDGHEVQDSNR